MKFAVIAATTVRHVTNYTMINARATQLKETKRFESVFLFTNMFLNALHAFSIMFNHTHERIQDFTRLQQVLNKYRIVKKKMQKLKSWNLNVGPLLYQLVSPPLFSLFNTRCMMTSASNIQE